MTKMAIKKLYSVIIPNTDSTLIGEILRRLRQQTSDLSQVEVFVVGTDKPGLVIEDTLVKFVPTDAQTSHASDKRNLGMQKAQGNIFLFLDDDCLPAPDWLECHLKRHQAGEKVVGGAVTFDTNNYLQLADNVSAFHDLLPFTAEGRRQYLSTSNLSVDREVVENAGYIEPQRSRAEDLEWTVRFRKLGYQLYFDPNVIIFHDPPRTTWPAVWRHWTDDASYTLKVRLRYQQLLQTPKLAKHRSVYLWGAPLVAMWATIRTFSHPATLRTYWYTLPLVYFTKLAWCWGAFKHFAIVLN